MSITLSMLKNKLYRIDKWISKDHRVLLVILLIASSVLMIQFENTIFIGIGLMGLICLWVVFVKTRISNGQLKFDKSYYTLPIIGEKIVVQKDFKYDLNKVINSKCYIHSEAYQNIEKGFEFELISIEELCDDWIVRLNCSLYDYEHVVFDVFWLDVKDYFMTITDIREEKLKKILG